MKEVGQKRTVRSFVRRQGRLTAGQGRALETLWPRYGLAVSDGLLMADAVFDHPGPLCLEIGFGMGDSLAAQAGEHPDRRYLGVEVHQPGVGHLLLLIESLALTNVRIYAEDSIEVLQHCIAAGSLAEVQVFFPDPWPKKKHHKRRLIDDAFISLVADRLGANGILHIATDWLPYADEIEALFAGREDFKPVPPPVRPETKFEQRGARLGHSIRDLAYRLTGRG